MQLHHVRRGEGEPLLLIQGMSGHSLHWVEPFLSLLEAHFDVFVAWSGEETDSLALQFAGEEPERCQVGEVLAALAIRLDRPREMEERRRAMKPAA